MIAAPYNLTQTSFGAGISTLFLPATGDSDESTAINSSAGACVAVRACLRNSYVLDPRNSTSRRDAASRGRDRPANKTYQDVKKARMFTNVKLQALVCQHDSATHRSKLWERNRAHSGHNQMIIHRLSYQPLVVTLVLLSWHVAQLPAAPPGVDYNLKLRFRISGVERSQVAAIERALNVAQLVPKIHVQKNDRRFVELSAELDRRADLGDIVKLINFALADMDTGAQPECYLIAYVSTDDVALAKPSTGLGSLTGLIVTIDG